MAVIQAFAHSLEKRYLTHVFTKATFFMFFIYVIIIIAPLLIAYRSYGFWKTEGSYREQPEVLFKHQIISVFDVGAGGDQLVWSTYHSFNQLNQDNLRSAVVKSREEDRNRDGKADVLHLSLQLPLTDTEAVTGVALILVFDYRLWKMSSFQMESLGLLNIRPVSTAGNPASAEVIASLKLVQKGLIPHSGTDTTYNTAVIDGTSVNAEDYDFTEIIRSYRKRNMTTSVSDVMTSWKSGRASGKPFVLNIELDYPEEEVRYATGLTEMFKYAFIQYIVYFWLLKVLLYDYVARFVFENQLFTTVPQHSVNGFHPHSE